MKATVLQGNCIDRLAEMEDESIGSFISDPPYGLKFMSKDFDDLGEGRQQREWHKKWLEQAFRVIKKGGVIKAFSGTRTYHHLVKAMAEVGFTQIRVEAWVYGSGFPKSLNIAKAFDRIHERETGEVGEVIGFTKGVGGENMNDIVNGKEVRTTDDEGGKGVGAYGTGAKQVAVDVPVREWVTEDAKTWEGWGTALKPAFEPVVIGYKP